MLVRDGRLKNVLSGPLLNVCISFAPGRDRTSEEFSDGKIQWGARTFLEANRRWVVAVAVTSLWVTRLRLK